jgi:hypothetical protein
MKTTEIKKCYSLLKEKNIWDDNYDILRKNFKLFALKNHPDKGGIKEMFQLVSSCKDILDNDFDYFKSVATNPEKYEYNEELFEEYDNSSDEDYNPNIESKKTSKSTTSKKSKFNAYTYVDFEMFIKKDCKGGRGGWLVNELRNFCDILGINNKGKKEELCEKLSKYFKDIELRKPGNDKEQERYEKKDVEELKQKDLLEQVYKEQERIRQEEERQINQLNDKMSNLSI